MVTLYYIQDKTKQFAHPEDHLIFSDKSTLENWMKRLSDGFMTLAENDQYEIRSIQVNGKCKCHDYRRTTMFLINVEDPKNIRLIGSDNFEGIHEKVRLPFDADIESYTNGKYQLMSEEYFHNTFKIEMK